jgi:ribose transport system permease protein
VITRGIGIWLVQSAAVILAVAVFIAMFSVYVAHNPAGLSPAVLTTAANKAVLLALVAMAQTIVVLTRGIDLSVGMVFIMTNCLASVLVAGTPVEIASGIIAVLLAAVAAGTLNGALVVMGRLPPIVVTLASGAIFSGIALAIRPSPGGTVDEGIADAFTSRALGVPTTLFILLGVVLTIWLPFRLSVIGRGCYAAGSAEGAAYMSGVAIGRSKFVAHVLASFLSGVAGLLITFLTLSGDASAPIGGTYTLNSVAAVVIGGTSLYGGSGGAIGSIFGAFILRTIDDLLLIFNLPPLWQPLFQGIVLLGAVCVGALRVFRVRNRLDLFG